MVTGTNSGIGRTFGIGKVWDFRALALGCQKQSDMKPPAKKASVLDVMIGIPAFLIVVAVVILIVWYGKYPYSFSLGQDIRRHLCHRIAYPLLDQ